MNENFKKLVDKLIELFMLNQPDLDFGIYRIMNSRRREITKFLEEDLLPQVRDALNQYETGSNANLSDELKKAVDNAKELGVDPDSSPKVKELKAKITEAGSDISQVENEVYSHLYNFFSRYYSGGDFLSLRRYKEGVYAIPYEGEEVKFYWANHDQYYIKTNEYLRDYKFNLPNDKKAHFKLTEADIEKDNRQESAEKERRFVLAESDFWGVEDGEIVLKFHYLPLGKGTNQKNLNSQAIEDIFAAEIPAEFKQQLEIKDPTEKNKDRTILEKHLNDYTSRYSFDYFIHKDLGGFLSRELDFYIKNEVMHLDDIEEETAPKVEQYLAKIRAIRKVAAKVITFLAQLEDFQKKLWLKKKFVTETNYCITLDRVPESLYEEITANDAQCKEWIKLFAIDEIKAEELGQVAYSNPLTIKFLKASPYLVLDTALFDESFNDKLIASIDNIDEQTDGMLIHSENFQALNLLQDRYREQVDCIYTDPPYNTDAIPILYKNGYKESSWATLIADRLNIARNIIADSKPFCHAIDDAELENLCQILKSELPNHELHKCIVEHYPGSGTGRSNVSRTHEYALYSIPKETDVLRGDILESGERIRGFRRSGTGANNFRRGRPNSFYAVLVDPDSKEIKGFEAPPIGDDYTTDNTPDGWLRIYPFGTRHVGDDQNPERVWSLSYESAPKALEEGRLICTDKLVIQRLYTDDERRELLPSIWQGAKFSAVSHGTNLIQAMFNDASAFSYPKSIYTVIRAIDSMVHGQKKSTTLDYFAGSGTTGHAVINLNREDNGSRKYILVEMGQYFDEVTKPRIPKAIYSAIWKDGKPLRIPEYIKSLGKNISDLKKELKSLKGIKDKEKYDFEVQRIKGEIDNCEQQITNAENHLTEGNDYFGVSHCFKYIRLESYEDTLNNLVLEIDKDKQMLLESNKKFKESYMLGYMLDVESKGSVLNIDSFKNPFDYKLNIATGSVGDTQPVKIDLVETFNYLIGLKVKTSETIRGFKVITGESLAGDKILVIWRNINEKDNDTLDEFCQKMKYNPLDMEFDLIYVNGDNNLENLKRDEDTWKVRMIEEEFTRLMFEN